MSRDYNFYVYILFDEPAKATYIGVTNDLERRMYEHKLELIDGFTKEKHIHKLAYYEWYTDINVAISREKDLKKWKEFLLNDNYNFKYILLFLSRYKKILLNVKFCNNFMQTRQIFI